MKYRKSVIFFAATLTLIARVASSEGELSALEQTFNTSGDVINKNVSEDQELLNDRDVFNELQALNKLNEELAVELLENGFVSVDDGEIADWESLLALNGPFLVNRKAVSEKLRFEPTSFIEQDGLEYIGSEAIGAIAKEGSDSVVSLYKTDFGAVSITETDVSEYESADMDDVTQSYFETTKVGELEVLLFVMRGQTKGEFETQLLWADELLNREYTISVNMNANDPTSSSHLENLFALVNKISN